MLKVKGNPKWHTLVVLMGGYDHTKSEKIWYHSFWEKNNKQTIRLWPNFSAHQLSPPEQNIAKQNWYVWYTFDVLNIHTTFHLDDIHSCWDSETAYLFINANPVILIKVRGHEQCYKCTELNHGYNHTKFDEAQYGSLWVKPNVKFLDTVKECTAGQMNTDHYQKSIPTQASNLHW